MFNEADVTFMKMMNEQMEKLKEEKARLDEQIKRLDGKRDEVIGVLEGLTWQEAESVLEMVQAKLKKINKVTKA